MPSVSRLFDGETIACVSCGPSLTQADVDMLRGRARVIAVSNAWELAPWADVLYSADHKWWQAHQGVPAFQGLKFAMQDRARIFPGVTVVARGRLEGLSLEPGTLSHGKTSGYQAINLAVQLGAKRIVLLGYDYSRGPQGKEHFFGDHHFTSAKTPWNLRVPFFASLVTPLAYAGVEIVNCTRHTAITCFPQRALAEVFPLPLTEVA